MFRNYCIRHYIFFARSYIGVQNGRGMFHFVQGYLCKTDTRSIAFGDRTMCGIRGNSLNGISSFKRLTAFVFVTQLDGIINSFAFRNTGNNNILLTTK